jgi:hypothetical protein
MTVVGDISFWKPVYQLFKPDEPLVKDELRDFYVRREDSPVDGLVALLALDDTAAKFLLAGHRGGGKTTELRRLEQRCAADYTVVWVDTDMALDRFNIGPAEVMLLIGMQIVQQLVTIGWQLPKALEKGLWESLAKVTYQDETAANGQLELPKVFQELGMLLRVGFQKETMRAQEMKPVLDEIVERINDIIAVAELDKPKLLVIVDGLDRKEYSIAVKMFSSNYMTSLQCHIVYVIPIALRYSTSFRQITERFTDILDLDNISVFKCDVTARPTDNPDKIGRYLLAEIIRKRLMNLGDTYKNIIEPEALDLLCETSGGVIRDLVRLVRKACEVGLAEKANQINRQIAVKAIQQEHKTYIIEDYHFRELEIVHSTGQLTNNTFDSPKQGKTVICNELLHYKLVLGYQDPQHGRWFDINPILLIDLELWKKTLTNTEAKDVSDLENYLDDTILSSLEKTASAYQEYLDRKDYARVVETAESAYEMCQELAQSLSQETAASQKLIALASYWKLNRDLYRGLI